MANKFEIATNNYGNNFSNNNGNHYYTTHGHNYDDSAYVLAKFNGQVDPTSISSTKNGYPSNNVTAYGQGYIVTVKSHSHVDDYTQTNTLGWPNNINTKGKIDGTLSFSVDKTSVPASGGTVNIHMPDLKYTATRGTRGYRYVDVTLKPDVPSNPDTLDDDGTAFSNSTVESTTYVGENRQGFLNYEEPRMDYVIYSSYGNKGDKPFWLRADTKIYNGPDAKTGAIGQADYYESTTGIVNTYMHMYDNLNTIFSYAYAPYHDEVKNNFGASEGVGWTHNNVRLEVTDNFLSTYPKKLTMSYKNSYWTISYDGVSDMPFTAAFQYMNTYGGVTSSTDIDNNLTSYDRSTVLYNSFPGSIANSSTIPSYLATSYTISQPKATLTPSYCWSLPESNGASNFDTKTGVKYVGFGVSENKYMTSTSGTKGFLTVAKQDHYMGYVSGNLDNTLASSATNRVITMDHGTSKEGTFGNLKWTDCENRTERFFNVRVSTKYDNCRNQNITSITNEYASGDKRKPEVTLKCRQLPAHWNHPGIHISIKSSRDVIPSDSRFDKINPTIGISTTSGWLGGTTTTYFSAGDTNGTNRIGWTISPHGHHLISTTDNNNSKLLLGIYMPTVSTPYVKSTVGGSISASASTTQVGPVKSDITITPTWNVNYTRGYDKGFDAAEWKYTFVSVDGYNDDPNSYGGDGMDCSNVTGFNDFIVHLNKCEDRNYRYPSITLTATSSNSTFSLGSVTTNTASDATSLADGAKSSGFTVSVPANPKTGSNWGASIVRTPTENQSGTIRITSGDMKNSVSRSTTISFSNSFDTNLTSGSITNPDSITITQRADKWGGGGSIGLCFEIVEGNAGQALDGGGVCLIKSIPDAGSNQTYSDFSIGKLKSKHQLVLTGIGTVAGSDKAPDYDVSQVTVTSTGTPASESSSNFTYTSTINAWCDDYASIGTTYGPYGAPSKYVTKYTVRPISTSWKRQYKFNNTWQNSATLNIGDNIGSTTGASCVTNSNAINNGPFTFTPSRYNGSSPRTLYYRVGVYDINSGALYENATDYKIVQGGSDPYYNDSSFTFSSSATRCTVKGLAKSVSGTEPKDCGSFTVTPANDPFYNYTSYTNGMVPNSFKINTFKEGITSDNSLTATHSGYVDFQDGTPINFWFGIAGSTSDYITWSRTGSVKYKFYYNYSVTCSSGASKSSGNLESSEITSTPSDNATNYYKRRLVDGSWSTSLTRPITSTGTYSVTGGWVTEKGIEYSTSRREIFSITVRTYTVETEYKYQIPTGTKQMTISFYDKDGNVATSPVVLQATSTTKYYVEAKGPNVKIQVSSRTYRHFNTGADESYSNWSDWSDTSTDAYTISPSSYTFADPTPGQTLTKQFILSVIETYNGVSVTNNDASGSTATFTVRKIGSNYDEYRVTSITLTSTKTSYETYDSSYTVTPTFDYKVQKRTLNGDGEVVSDWDDITTKSGEVTINETSHIFSNMEVNKEYSFTFSADIISGVTNATNRTMPVTLTVKVTRKASVVYRTVYKYTGSVSATVSNQIITAFDTDKSQVATPTWSCTYWKRTDSRKSNETAYTNGTWEQIDQNDKYGSINSTTYTFNNVPLGSSSTTTGSASYTFVVTPPSNPSNLNDGTFETTVYAYKYGKTYYNS